jgi:hypothetical protein
MRMTLSQANVWVLKLLPFYEHIFTHEGGNPGLPFDQLYDIPTVQPLAFWQAMYETVKADLRGMGLAL